jgi:hypothetical protein
MRIPGIPREFSGIPEFLDSGIPGIPWNSQQRNPK